VTTDRRRRPCGEVAEVYRRATAHPRRSSGRVSCTARPRCAAPLSISEVAPPHREPDETGWSGRIGTPVDLLAETYMGLQAVRRCAFLMSAAAAPPPLRLTVSTDGPWSMSIPVSTRLQEPHRGEVAISVRSCGHSGGHAACPRWGGMYVRGRPAKLAPGVDVPLERRRQRLVEVVDVEDQAPDGRGEHAEVEQ